MGFSILPPHVNKSEIHYTVEKDPAVPNPSNPALRVGLGQVTGVSTNCLERIIESRKARGGFRGLMDFLDRLCRLSAILAMLVRSGCLDGLGFCGESRADWLTRPQMLWAHHQWKRGCGKGNEKGQAVNLFDAWTVPDCIGDYSEARKLSDEVDSLGLIISRVPASIFTGRAVVLAKKLGLPELSDSRMLDKNIGKRVAIAGTAVAGKEVLTKHRESMSFRSFEDCYGLFETVFFPKVYESLLPMLERCSAMLLVGKVQCDTNALTLQVETAYALNRSGRG